MKSKPTVEDLVVLRKQGWSTNKIARFYNIPFAVVEDAVRGSVRMVDVVPASKALRLVDLAIAMWRKGMTLQAIADHLNVPVGTVGAWMSNAGLLKHGSKNMSDSET